MHDLYKPGTCESYNYSELCPMCGEYIAVSIDDACYEYEATCPCCGYKILLCTLCQWDWKDEHGSLEDFVCDQTVGNHCFRTNGLEPKERM